VRRSVAATGRASSCRAAIEAGALDGQKLEICWLKDPSDLLAIQIEDSARVILEDGTPLRINYDSHNGYSYTSVSRVLIKRNRIPREEEMSMQRIRDWMTAHPDEAAKVRAANRSYVFFRITGLSNEGEPVGAQGVPLTPGRSIAVDRLHDNGTPFFIEASTSLDISGALMAKQDRRCTESEQAIPDLDRVEGIQYVVVPAQILLRGNGLEPGPWFEFA
jgi:membrane-bound lytic murein transglycosylase